MNGTNHLVYHCIEVNIFVITQHHEHYGTSTLQQEIPVAVQQTYQQHQVYQQPTGRVVLLVPSQDNPGQLIAVPCEYYTRFPTCFKDIILRTIFSLWTSNCLFALVMLCKKSQITSDTYPLCFEDILCQSHLKIFFCIVQTMDKQDRCLPFTAQHLPQVTVTISSQPKCRHSNHRPRDIVRNARLVWNTSYKRRCSNFWMGNSSWTQDVSTISCLQVLSLFYLWTC